MYCPTRLALVAIVHLLFLVNTDMELYLNSTGIISGAGNNSDANFLNASPDAGTQKLLCKEPDYSGYIQPMQLRRMSKAVRIGIGASKICMQNAGIEKPDAISIGTAMG